MLSSAKDGLKIKAPSVYWIPYECGKFYIGQTGNYQNEVQGTPEIHTSASTWDFGSGRSQHQYEYYVGSNGTFIFHLKSGYTDRLLMQAI